MKVSNERVKQFLVELVMYTPEVDLDGQKVSRRSFPKEHIKGLKEIKDKILKSVEIGYAKPEDVVEENDRKTVPVQKLEWKTVGEKPSAGYAPFTERYPNTEVELSHDAIQAAKFYWTQLADVPDYAMDVIDDINLLFEGDK